MFLCTSASLVLCCDQFDRGSRQVMCEPVDLVTVDYDVSLCQRILLRLVSGPTGVESGDHSYCCDVGKSLLETIPSPNRPWFSIHETIQEVEMRQCLPVLSTSQ